MLYVPRTQVVLVGEIGLGFYVTVFTCCDGYKPLYKFSVTRKYMRGSVQLLTGLANSVSLVILTIARLHSHSKTIVHLLYPNG